MSGKTLAPVTAGEQPYPLPEVLEWVRLGDVTSIVGGGTPSTSVSEYYEGGMIPWISQADLSDYDGMYISVGGKHYGGLDYRKVLFA